MELDKKTYLWIIAAPFLFLLHEAEEYLTALPWLADHIALVPTAIARLIPPTSDFIAYAGVAFFVIYLIAGLVAIKSRSRALPWIILAILMMARLENAALHTLESVVLFSYTPGAVTAILIIAPVTIYLVRRFIQLGLISRRSLIMIVPTAFVVQTAAIATMLMLG
ncbi:MAG TPA: HXXEE domain-containing protein [Gemmatimonadaceae bacterium]